MALFIAMESMLFAGLISAYLISRDQNYGTWPPPGEPRLAIPVTAFNTLVLLASGVVIWRSGKVYVDRQKQSSALLLAGTVMGAFFVLFQGAEWLKLLHEGLTFSYSTHSSFFYLIVGIHALHAICALIALTWANLKARQGQLTFGAFWTVRLFWYFVVGVWPVLYYLVYLH